MQYIALQFDAKKHKQILKQTNNTNKRIQNVTRQPHTHDHLN